MIKLQSDGSSVLIPVKVVPGASRTRLMGEFDGRLKVAVAAPPERGKANAALIAFLAKELGVRRQAVCLVSGAASPLKTVRAEGVTVEQILDRLGLG